MTNHTAQLQILPLLESDEKPTIDEIENAFKWMPFKTFLPRLQEII